MFHNLRGYDGHLIMQALGGLDWGTRMVWHKQKKTGKWVEKEVKRGEISCIPYNMEKYMTFSVDQLQFIDSLQFTNSSLDSLANTTSDITTTPCGVCGMTVYLPEVTREALDYVASGPCTMCDIPQVKRVPWNTLAAKFPVTSAADSDRAHLLMRKGVYPYEYVDSFDRFTKTSLQPKEAFYSHLIREHNSDNDYVHAQRVWREFGCKTLGDYHDLYLRMDMHILADVFEAFRNTSMENYGLVPAYYFSAPGLSWDALLKHTGVELEILIDIHHYLFIEKGFRGGIAMVSKRFTRTPTISMGVL